MSEPLCVIVGAGHAAAQLGPSLRKEGWQGRILMVGDEPWLPYNRPPLSKTFLGGDKSEDELLIRPHEAYVTNNIQWQGETRITGIDRPNQRLRTTDGDFLAYDRLVLATGGSPRPLNVPGSRLEGVHYLRTIADVQAIRRQVAPGRRAVIIGGGYIGLETAAMLRQLGLEVRVLESEKRLLSRVTTEVIAGFFTRLHREEGIQIDTCAQVSAIGGEDRVQEVQCTDGQVFPADLVIIGIGIIPNTQLAEQAGLDIDHGIVVDAHCRTSDPHIYAMGDCACFYSERYQRYMRVESVQNAVDQARVAAANVCGNRTAYNALPWFWSDQYDVKLQIAGLSAGHDQQIVRGDPEQGRKFAVLYMKEGRLLAVDAVNSPQEFMLGKRIIESGHVVSDTDALADPAVPMKSFLG